MTATTVLLPGVDAHGAGYRVRVRFGAHRHVEAGFATPDAANARALELRTIRDAGLLPAAVPVESTLAAAAEALIARKRVSGKRKPLRKRGLEYWERSCKPWLDGDFAALPLSLLRRDRVEDAVLSRAAAAPTAAKHELEALKATLKYAGDRGARFDPALLTIEPVPVTPRQRVAVSVEALEALAACAPDYGRRLILFRGTTGLRSGETFTLTDDRVDLDGRTVFIPADLCKEGEDKLVPLTAEEVTLLREQLVARAAGARLVFPKRHGTEWTRSHFNKLVWKKATAKAADVWRERQRLDDAASTPFDDLQPHDLRSTAATLMRDAGFTKDQAAARLGHADTGELLDRVYDRGDRPKRVRRALDELVPHGLRAAALAEPAPRPSATPVAGGSTLGEA